MSKTASCLLAGVALAGVALVGASAVPRSAPRYYGTSPEAFATGYVHEHAWESSLRAPPLAATNIVLDHTCVDRSLHASAVAHEHAWFVQYAAETMLAVRAQPNSGEPSPLAASTIDACKASCAAAAKRPALVSHGYDADLNPDVMPLEHCHGDCDHDGHCKAGYKCHQQDQQSPIPGCEGTPDEAMDYCVRSSASAASAPGGPAICVAPGLRGPWLSSTGFLTFPSVCVARCALTAPERNRVCLEADAAMTTTVRNAIWSAVQCPTKAAKKVVTASTTTTTAAASTANGVCTCDLRTGALSIQTTCRIEDHTCQHHLNNYHMPGSTVRDPKDSWWGAHSTTSSKGATCTGTSIHHSVRVNHPHHHNGLHRCGVVAGACKCCDCPLQEQEGCRAGMFGEQDLNTCSTCQVDSFCPGGKGVTVGIQCPSGTTTCDAHGKDCLGKTAPSDCRDINECDAVDGASNDYGFMRCDRDAVCANTRGTFSCECAEGYRNTPAYVGLPGTSCSFDTTGCPVGQYRLRGADCVPCDARHYCPGGPELPQRRACAAGYTTCDTDGTNCGSKALATDCRDVDECNPTDRAANALAANPAFKACAAHATCSNTPGGYNCACFPGYIGGGLACTVCAAGKFEHEHHACKACGTGRHAAQGAVGCTSCAVGSYQPSTLSAACLSCAGWTQGVGGDLGHHSAAAGHTGCTAHTECKEGEVETRAAGPGHDRRCAYCPAGHKCDGDATAIPCEAGDQFQDRAGSTTCKDCAACPYWTSRVGCKLESAGKCEACASCPKGHKRVGCHGTSRGSCVHVCDFDNCWLGQSKLPWHGSVDNWSTHALPTPTESAHVGDNDIVTLADGATAVVDTLVLDGVVDLGAGTGDSVLTLG